MRAEFKTAKGRAYQANQRYRAKKLALSKASAKVNTVADVRTIVNRAIATANEDKHYIKNVYFEQSIPGCGFNSTSTNSGLTTTDSIIPLVVQGDTVSNRDGNRIKVKNLSVRLQLQARPVNVLNNVEGLPFYVRVVFYYRKDSMTNNTNTGILDEGPNSANFTYDTGSLLLNYNKDLFTIVKSKTYKMAPCQAVDGAGVTSVRDPPNGFVSHVLKKFSIKCPKNLIYDDNSAQPMHRIYCAIGVINADGSNISPVSNGTRCRVSLDTHLIFEDS